MACLAAAWQPGRLKSESSSIALALAEVGAANPEVVLELDADGTLLERSPTGGSTSARNLALPSCRPGLEAPAAGSLARPQRGGARLLSARDGLPPLGPELVVGLASLSEDPPALRRKLAAYLANGARLGWLLLPLTRSVEVWTPTPPQPGCSLVTNGWTCARSSRA